jgi:hypothetical protein
MEIHPSQSRVAPGDLSHGLLTNYQVLNLILMFSWFIATLSVGLLTCDRKASLAMAAYPHSVIFGKYFEGEQNFWGGMSGDGSDDFPTQAQTAN